MQDRTRHGSGTAEMPPHRYATGHRDLLSLTAVVATTSLAAGGALAQAPAGPARALGGASPGHGGLLRPQRNAHREVIDASGLWRFQLDPREEGEAAGWAHALPTPCMIPVPCSWNDLFDDVRDHLGLAWYQTDLWVPAGWRDRRVILRVGSANYAARVWVNGTLVTEHQGGHLPFEADVTAALAWDRANTISISVENKQLLCRVPPGPGPGGGGVAGVVGGVPADDLRLLPLCGPAPPRGASQVRMEAISSSVMRASFPVPTRRAG